MAAPRVQFPPMRNGLDYIEQVVDRLGGTPTACDLKYAVLHLQAAVEVLLKVRLVREHWALVFKDANKADKAAFASGDFISIGMDETLKRLDGVAGVSLPRAISESFRKLANTRNKLQHFGLDDSAEAIEAQAGEVLHGLLEFLREHLRSGGEFPDDDEALRETEELISDELHRLRALTQARLDAIGPKLDAADSLIIECPRCRNTALIIGGEANCLFCHFHWDDSAALATEYASTVLGISSHDIARGAEWPVASCFECEMESLVAGVDVRRGHSDSYACFQCGVTAQRGKVGMCDVCGEPMIQDEESGTLCGTCLADLVNSSD